MRYTKPLVVRIEEASVAIQQVGQPDLNKPPDIFQDVSFVSCTAGAYEADE